MECSPIFKDYFDYVGQSECPAIFHRWALLSSVGALLERNVWIPFGHTNIYPNMYVILMGSPGTRKGSAIRPAKYLMEELGYDKFAPSTAAKEALWFIMSKVNEGAFEDVLAPGADMSQMLVKPTASPLYIMRDEFTAFLGDKAKSMVESLTDLWDNPPEFTNPKLRTDDVVIHNPTLNMLSGTTPSSLSDALDTLALSGGFTSRVLFIYSQPKDLRIAWPEDRQHSKAQRMLEYLERARKLKGPLCLTEEVKDLIATIYYKTPRVADGRFIYYGQRRQIHLLKLIMIIACGNGTLKPTTRMVIEANTILHAAELGMPQALGEFGLAKASRVSNTILDYLKHAEEAPDLRGIYREVSRDLNSFKELNEVLNDLMTANKVQRVTLPTGKQVYLANLEYEDNKWPEYLINYDVLTQEEAPEAIQGQLV